MSTSYPQLENIINKYRIFLWTKGATKQTIKNYLSDANIFFSWCLSNQIDLKSLDKEAIDKFKSYTIYNNHHSSKTVKRRLSSLASIILFLKSIHIIQNSTRGEPHKNTAFKIDFTQPFPKRHLSKNTIKNYRSDISQLTSWLKEKNIALTDSPKNILDLYKNNFLNTLPPSTAKRKFSVAKNFLNNYYPRTINNPQKAKEDTAHIIFTSLMIFLTFITIISGRQNTKVKEDTYTSESDHSLYANINSQPITSDFKMLKNSKIEITPLSPCDEGICNKAGQPEVYNLLSAPIMYTKTNDPSYWDKIVTVNPELFEIDTYPQLSDYDNNLVSHNNIGYYISEDNFKHLDILSANEEANLIVLDGKGSIKNGTSEITILNTNITPNSKIHLTPLSSTNNSVLYVRETGEGYFKAGFEDTIDIDVQFAWMVVESSLMY